ncbi:MAG: hypothetical protein VR72_09280 [Clostridiaceae bacterium BRH_c20a]|nr:MAG: hypothetical protein VR72_09280 [Clostridiaceae bacterium BRH_c20a]
MSAVKVMNKEYMQWEIDVPIFRDPIILRQLAIAIGIPFGLLFVILLIVMRGKVFTVYTLYALGLISATFLLTYLLIMIVYGGKYGAGFIIDDKGILNYTQKKQAKRNLIINVLTVVLGLLSRKPAAMGAGLLAQSRQTVFIKWKKIQKVQFYPQSKTILLRGGFSEKIAVFCTEKNYSQVEEVILQKADNVVIPKMKH